MPEVLFEDNHCLALSKPGGLLTQGLPVGLPTLWSWARDYLKTKYNKLGNVYLGVPHRLDRPVSGVVLFAKSSKAAARLAEQFRDRSVKKIYWALVEGRMTKEEVWIDWLRKIQDEARAERVNETANGARQAVTQVRVIQSGQSTSFVEFAPETGRMHQLRIQSASRGHPILGDRLYGSTIEFGPPTELDRDRVIALHARSITFLHPIRYKPMTVEADVPPSWNSPDSLNSIPMMLDRRLN